MERGVGVDPATIMRWVHRYAPALEKRVRWYQGYRASSWRVDETYGKVGGMWKYLFRAVASFRLRTTHHTFITNAAKIVRIHLGREDQTCA